MTAFLLEVREIEEGRTSLELMDVGCVVFWVSNHSLERGNIMLVVLALMRDFLVRGICSALLGTKRARNLAEPP